MSKNWDKAVPSIEIWKECLRVLKPGAFAFVMSIPRQDCLARMICNLQDAGFEMGFSSVYYCYGTGFPKAGNVSKMVDKRLGVEREVTGTRVSAYGDAEFSETEDGRNLWSKKSTKTVELKSNPATPQAKVLNGSFAGFQPKPAVEVIICCMKPLSEKTYLDQAMKNGKGITWLGDCKIPCQDDADKEKFLDSWDSERGNQDSNLYKLGLAKQYSRGQKQFKPRARFPANLLVSDDVLNDGKAHTAGDLTGQPRTENTVYNTAGAILGRLRWYKGDSGSFSRYFSLDSWWEKKLKELPESAQKTFPFLITPKPSKREKNLGCEELVKGEPPASARSKPAPGRKSALGEPRTNSHPTVKSLKLFSYLITLGSRPGDLVCDPFCGSGTTCIAAELLGRKYIGIDNDPDSVRIARARLRYWRKQLKLF